LFHADGQTQTDITMYDDAYSLFSQIFRTRLKIRMVNLSLFITGRRMARV